VKARGALLAGRKKRAAIATGRAAMEMRRVFIVREGVLLPREHGPAREVAEDGNRRRTAGLLARGNTPFHRRS
jgi:hypothetical protein